VTWWALPVRAPWLWLAITFAACAPTATDEVSSSADALRGGTPDSSMALPQVFMLRVKFDTGMQFVCTATLITSRTLLTAAHCFDPAAAPSGTTALTDVFVQNATIAPASTSPSWVRIDPAQTRMHPQWRASDRLSFDIAAALLPAPSALTPSPHLSRTLVAADVGQNLTVAGFGITAAGQTDFGTRRVATLPLRAFTSKHVQLGDMSSTGICNGDSGGPSFLAGRDGIKRVVGVHSYDSSLQCNDGLDTRVDLFAASFVQQFIKDFEGGPTCFEDGMCASGCPGVDVDCVCAADGACNAACPNLLTDPDCPADCVPNGVCARENCPVLDADCTAELGACTADTQCQYRQCVTDPQRPQRYCSRACSDGCGPGTSCVGAVCLQMQKPTANAGEACDAATTFCLGGTTCTGFPVESTTCRRTCATNGDCGANGECANAQNGVKLCVPMAVPGEDCVLQVTRCLQGTSCTGLPGEQLACRDTCLRNTDCATGESCVDAQANLKVCAKDPIFVPALGTAESKAMGCSTALGSSLVWLAALLISARRRARP